MTTRVAEKMLSVIFRYVSLGEWRNLGNAPVLGTGGEILVGSSPTSPTNKTSLSNKTGIDSFVSLSDFETNKKTCCSRCCIEDKMLQSSLGMCREMAASKTLSSFRNYPPKPHIPTTAYSSSIATSIF